MTTTPTTKTTPSSSSATATKTTNTPATPTVAPLRRRRTRLVTQAVARDAQAGDIIFVRPAPDDRVGYLIAEATHGPYAHVRVRLSHDQVIEALDWQGVRRDAVGNEPNPVDVAHIGVGLEAPRFVRGRTWLLSRVGAKYSLWDIAADAVKACLPAAWGGRTPFLINPSRLDCSELATRFLIHAGYEWLPDELMDDPARVSPNDLARALGVIK